MNRISGHRWVRWHLLGTRRNRLHDQIIRGEGPPCSATIYLGIVSSPIKYNIFRAPVVQPEITSIEVDPSLRRKWSLGWKGHLHGREHYEGSEHFEGSYRPDLIYVSRCLPIVHTSTMTIGVKLNTHTHIFIYILYIRKYTPDFDICRIHAGKPHFTT